MVEREAACLEILATRMEEGSLDPAPIWSDARTFDGLPWRGAVDIVTAGYPCQPFSTAGLRKGTDDPRHLWPDIKRIVAEVRPRAVVLENVQGHIRLGMSSVLEDLHELGYDAEWGMFSAAQAGAPHRRNRLFIVAYRNGDGCLGEWLRLQRGRSQQGRPEATRSREGVAHTHGIPDELLGGPGELQRAEGSLQGEGASQRDTPYGSLSGAPGDWPPGPAGDWSTVRPSLYPATEPSVRGVADGVPGRVDRLRALGNAVVPQQATLALTELIQRIQ
jgi:DNA (cytosine-5)-methyltransferase 1